MGNTAHKDPPKPVQQTCLDGCRRICAKCMAIALCVTVIILAISEIVVAVTNGLATKLYSSDLSGRVVAMSVLSLTAAVTLASTIYAMVGLIRKKKKPLHVTGVVLLVMAIIQALLCGIAVKVSPHDEATLSNSLAKSFNQALEGHPKHYKLWEITNSGLECCGLNGPEDYREPGAPVLYAPDVPISCCSTYDPSKSELLQEKERQVCRARKEYYYTGCGGLVKAGFRNSASAVLSTTILFIVLEVLLAATSWIAYKKYSRCEKERNNQEECDSVQVQTTKTSDTQVSQDLHVPEDTQEVKNKGHEKTDEKHS